MAYENKPGQGALFPNDQKQHDNQPDYRGQIKLPDGTDCWISGWLKQGSRGDFISISVQAKEQQRQVPKAGRLPPPQRQSPPVEEDDMDQTIPF